MGSVFADMATECIDGLDADERLSVPPRVFTKIVRICSEFAEANLCQRILTVDGLPRPPATQLIRAHLLGEGDFVWRETFSFDVIESVTVTDIGVVICLTDGTETLLAKEQLKRVAMCRAQADEWNLNRVLFTDETIEMLALAYGTYSG